MSPWHIGMKKVPTSQSTYRDVKNNPSNVLENFMGNVVKVKASDGFTFDAYKAVPTGPVRGAIVVLQEIFGVNAHIRRVTESFAEIGYIAVAPALFDRVQKGTELTYSDSDFDAAMALWKSSSQEDALKDVAASIDAVSEEGQGKVGVVGYCWGGALSFIASGNLPGIKATVSYYGNVPAHLDVKPKVPLMMHFSEHDKHVSIDAVPAIRELYPQAQVYTYDADHGFNTLPRKTYQKESADLALERTLGFLSMHVG
jgi:carboxymethylenebutenolidase